MRWSKIYLSTLKEDPLEAEMTSHKLLIRSGMIGKLASGIYTYHFLALKALRKIEKIVRKHMEKTGVLEILMPFVQPQSIWEDSGRIHEMGDNLLKFQNRSKQKYCLGATHEEAVIYSLKNQLKSYKDLPCLVYQIQTKYRDEIRPRFGLIRAREFIMKDAYSFDLLEKDALQTYESFKKSYEDIFAELGLKFCIVKADSGAIGGNQSEEFHVISEKGMDEILMSEDSSFFANKEICPCVNEKLNNENEQLKKKEIFETKNIKTIKELSKFLKLPENKLVKTLFYEVSDKNICVLLRGDHDLNLLKLQKITKSQYLPKALNETEVKKITNASFGSLGPVSLKIPIFMDEAVSLMKNYITGANKEDFHLKNVNHPRDFEVFKVADLRDAKDGDLSPHGKRLKKINGIEVAHIFYLGQKYSKKLSLSVLDEKGGNTEVFMGCYGMGISRILQASLEQSHDEKGIIWPEKISPFKLHLNLLDPKDELSLKITEKIEALVKKKGEEVFVDDRIKTAGVKFKDAELLGFPHQIILGKKSLKNKELEYISRKTQKKEKIKLEKLENLFDKIL